MTSVADDPPTPYYEQLAVEAARLDGALQWPSANLRASSAADLPWFPERQRPRIRRK